MSAGGLLRKRAISVRGGRRGRYGTVRVYCTRESSRVESSRLVARKINKIDEKGGLYGVLTTVAMAGRLWAFFAGLSWVCFRGARGGQAGVIGSLDFQGFIYCVNEGLVFYNQLIMISSDCIRLHSSHLFFKFFPITNCP